jgi:hypothetical protein
MPKKILPNEVAQRIANRAFYFYHQSIKDAIDPASSPIMTRRAAIDVYTFGLILGYSKEKIMRDIGKEVLP